MQILKFIPNESNLKNYILENKYEDPKNLERDSFFIKAFIIEEEFTIEKIPQKELNTFEFNESEKYLKAFIGEAELYSKINFNKGDSIIKIIEGRDLDLNLNYLKIFRNVLIKQIKKQLIIKDNNIFLDEKKICEYLKIKRFNYIENVLCIHLKNINIEEFIKKMEENYGPRKP